MILSKKETFFAMSILRWVRRDAKEKITIWHHKLRFIYTNENLQCNSIIVLNLVMLKRATPSQFAP